MTTADAAAQHRRQRVHDCGRDEPQQQAGEGRPQDGGELVRGGTNAIRFRELRACDQHRQQGRARRLLNRSGGAEPEQHAVERHNGQRFVRRTCEQQTPERSGCHRPCTELAAIETVGDHSARNEEREHGHELNCTDEAQRDGRVRALIQLVAHRDREHRAADDADRATHREPHHHTQRRFDVFRGDDCVHRSRVKRTVRLSPSSMVSPSRNGKSSTA